MTMNEALTLTFMIIAALDQILGIQCAVSMLFI
jgi:hypothetical protein